MLIMNVMKSRPFESGSLLTHEVLWIYCFDVNCSKYRERKHTQGRVFLTAYHQSFSAGKTALLPFTPSFKRVSYRRIVGQDQTSFIMSDHYKSLVKITSNISFGNQTLCWFENLESHSWCPQKGENENSISKGIYRNSQK